MSIKLSVLLAPFLLFSHSISAQGIKWETKSISLGKVDVDGIPKRMVYRFSIEGEKAIQISRVEVSCNCTNPIWPSQKMPPGHQDSIVVTFKPKGFVGEVNNSIQVFNSNSGVDDLNYTAEVYSSILDYQNEQMDYHPGKYGFFRMLEHDLSFGVLANDRKIIKTIVVYNESENRNLTIEKWLNLPSYVQVSTTKEIISPQDTMQIKFILDGTHFKKYGAIRESVAFITNDPKYPKKSISLSTYIVPGVDHLKRRDIKKGARIRASQQEIDFGHVKSGSINKSAVTLYNTGKKDLVIYKTESDCNCAVVSNLPASIAPGDSAVITVSLDALFKHDYVVQNIDFIVNDPTQTVFTIKLSAFVPKK